MNQTLDPLETPAKPAESQSIAVDIYDQIYHLRGTDPAYIERLAAIVDTKMRAVSAHGGTVDSLRVAVLQHLTSPTNSAPPASATTPSPATCKIRNNPSAPAPARSLTSSTKSSKTAKLAKAPVCRPLIRHSRSVPSHPSHRKM